MSRQDALFRIVAILAMVLSTLPLAIYPFVLLANIMGLAAEANYPDPGSETATLTTKALTLAAKAFMYGSTAYPVVWMAGLVGGIAMLGKRRFRAAMAAALVPLAYLGGVGILFGLWTAM